jgi:nitrite reductase (NADH) large subunit
VSKRYSIIGASAAGIGCALRLRMFDAEAQITVLTAEGDLPYNKCVMADVLLGEKSLDEITFCNQAMLEQKRIELIRDTRVAEIDPEKKLMLCEGGKTFAYDSLCIATGKSPRMSPLFENKKFTNLFNFYYKSDLESIMTYTDPPSPLLRSSSFEGQARLRRTGQPRTAAIIGAGLTGLEAADGLRARGLEVTIVEAASQLLASLINEPASQFITKKIEAAGATVITGEKIVGYEERDNCITELQLSSGKRLQPDLVVCAIGATPNTQFLPPAVGLKDGYCVVDEYMQTSAPGIYAAGDCCLVYDQLTRRVQPNALWPDAMQQGMCAAYGMAGAPRKYPGSVSIASSSFFGIKVAVAGPVINAPHQRVMEQETEDCYHRLVYDNDKLVGFMLIGNTTMLSDHRRQLLSQ